MPLVLIIDDDPLVRSTVSRILQRDGYEVVCAENGQQGVALFSRLRPETVITDMIMPEKTGLEVIQEVLLLAPNARIIAVSGGARIGHDDLLLVAQRLGVKSTIAKPFGPAELRAAMQVA